MLKTQVMLLLTLIPTILAFLSAVSAAPADTNADRMRRGLPLKAPGTAVRRQTPTVSQGVNGGTNGVLTMVPRQPNRRSLQERIAPSSGYLGFDGTDFQYAASVANAAVLNFPSDVGTSQPVRVMTSSGLQYITIISTGTGTYKLGVSPTMDASSLFDWQSVSGGQAGNLVAKISGTAIYFRLDGSNNKLLAVNSFGESSDLNPVWLFPTKAPITLNTPAGLQAEVDKMVRSTNAYRAQYGASPLTYSQTIADFAQTVANKCDNQHSTGSGYGENLYYGGFNTDSDTAIDGWGTQEAKLYNWDNPGFSLQTGHFTALVWKATTQLGCAWKLCPPNTLNKQGSQDFEALYIVCKSSLLHIWPALTHQGNYSPAGNVQGQFNDQVGRKV